MSVRESREADVYTTLGEALRSRGMILRGGFCPTSDAPVLNGRAVRTIFLIGTVGSGFWPHFQAFREQHSGEDPLDDWSRSVIDPVANEFGGVALYPFDRPWWPFQRWIAEAEHLKASPLGILIHPEFGHWHGYRGAIGLFSEMDLPAYDSRPHPCETCTDKPCITSCPAGALASGHFEVSPCRAHLARSAGAPCMARGCLSRNACPVGKDYRYVEDHVRFHMDALE